MAQTDCIKCVWCLQQISQHPDNINKKITTNEKKCIYSGEKDLTLKG